MNSRLPPYAQVVTPPDRWSLRLLLWAPHRLGFFLAMVVLFASAAWWVLVQCDRMDWLGGARLAYAVSPSLTHATVMSFGFMPLFFSGFLFTAGPKWLGVPAPTALQLLPALLLQSLGWLLWLAGAHMGQSLAVAGGVLAWVGLGGMYTRFGLLLRSSRVPDRVHANVIGCAGCVGVFSLGGVLWATWTDQVSVATASVQTGLWGCVVVTFLTVVHRMLPFFTASALPSVELWRPRWVLWLLLSAVVLALLAVWQPLWAASHTSDPQLTRLLMLAIGMGEVAVGSVVLWLAVVWGLVQSLKVRLLAMLHLGFLWFGLAMLLSGSSQLLGIRLGTPVLGLGALHAMTMGFLGSLLLAMVTRVSTGHSGRSLMADDRVWRLFWVLQLAVLVRIAASVPHAPGWALVFAASLWAVTVILWGVHLLRWYVRPRADGKPD